MGKCFSLRYRCYVQGDHQGLARFLDDLQEILNVIILEFQQSTKPIHSSLHLVDLFIAVMDCFHHLSCKFWLFLIPDSSGYMLMGYNHDFVSFLTCILLVILSILSWPCKISSCCSSKIVWSSSVLPSSKCSSDATEQSSFISSSSGSSHSLSLGNPKDKRHWARRSDNTIDFGIRSVDGFRGIHGAGESPGMSVAKSGLWGSISVDSEVSSLKPSSVPDGKVRHSLYSNVGVDILLTVYNKDLV